jgi:glyoxylase-like metal-dependent hydrolase (beta-lactamase superfamily II)
MAANIVNVGYDSTNCFAIGSAERGFLLVDCVWPGSLGKFRTQLRRNRIELEDFTYLLVTHYHPDHAGLAQELANAGIRIVLVDVQLPYVGQLGRYMKPDSGYIEIDTEAALLIGLSTTRAFLKSIGLEGEILHTPGHSDDSVSLVLDEGVAFTGDLTPEIGLTEEDALCRDSWRRIYERGVTRVFPAHGNAHVKRA